MATQNDSNVYDFVNLDIREGDRVRAYVTNMQLIDSYVEGVVDMITEHNIDGHRRYVVAVDREVKVGNEVDLPYQAHVGKYLVYPRVNGSPCRWGEGLGRGVVLLERPSDAEEERDSYRRERFS